jgi:ATP-binding cassette subfamily C protein
MLDDFSKCFTLLSPALRRRWIWLIPLGVLAAAAEAVGAAAIFLFLQVIADPDAIETLPVVSAFTPLTPRLDDRTMIVVLGGSLMLFYLARNLILSGVTYLREGLVQLSIVEVGDRLFDGYLRAPYAFHLGRHSATLIQQTRASVRAAYELVLAAGVQMGAELLVVIALAALLVTVAPVLTLAAGAVTLALVLLANPLSRRYFVRSGEQHKQIDAALLQHLQQGLGLLREVKLAGREPFFVARVTEQRRALGRVRHHRAALDTGLRLALETAFLCVTMLVIILVSLTFGPGSEVMALLGLFAYATFRLVPSANRITLYISNARSGHAFVRDLHADLQALSATPSEADAPDAGDLPFTETLALERVSFIYDTRDVHAVREVDLLIRPGESIGIVGPTGAGKSTLVDLILGLLEPTTGRITVDGRDARTARRAWQRQLGYVPQELYLIDDTVRRNIAFGLADRDIDDARVREAARLALLDQLVDGWPDGLDTIIGERGAALSGGQRQRVAIARALYRRPSVLVFDEATSALDTATEREIIDAIERMHGSVTAIVIAHRLTTIRRYDRIVVMDDGRIVDTGRFDDLLERSALFRDLAG